jgi:RimJ/RimL family protein N-acetyltransferase
LSSIILAMKPLAPLTLTGHNVTLEPLRPEHAPLLLTAANAARATFGFTLVPRDLEGMQALIATAQAEQESGVSLPFVVRDSAGVVSGTTRFMSVEHWTFPAAAPEPRPTGPDVVEIGFTWYAERVQRTALNTEAKLLLCTHAFETWRVRRVMWKTDARNARSRAAILRLGAQFDGVLRANRPASDSLVRDTAFFSMLASEWPEARRRLSARLTQGPQR